MWVDIILLVIVGGGYSVAVGVLSHSLWVGVVSSGFVVGGYLLAKVVRRLRRRRQKRYDVWTPHGIRPAPTDEQLRWAQEHPGELLPPELR